MEKNKVIYECIIKFVTACIAILCAIFIVENIISMFPLFNSLKLSENEIWTTIYKTRLGTLYNGMVISDDSAILIMVQQGLFSFFKNMQWYVIIFLCFVLILFVLYFIYPEWRFIKSYVKVTSLIIGVYLLKYLFIVLGIAIFFNESIKSISIGLIFDTTFSTIFDLLLLFLFGLFIVKFIANLSSDVKEIHTLMIKSS